MNTKQHWETVYSTKKPNEVSWTQEIPKTSIDFLDMLNLPKEAGIIDVGGGDSKFVDYLVDKGFKNITVLDISEKALERAKERLKEKSEKVSWIVSDITEFVPKTKYDLWHDRATFHFLTEPEQRKKYKEMIENEFSENFEKIYCKKEDHITPFNTIQNFLFCSFKKRF